MSSSSIKIDIKIIRQTWHVSVNMHSKYESKVSF